MLFLGDVVRIHIPRSYQYKFDQIRVTFSELIYTVAPLIAKSIPSLQDFKTYLRRCFRELRPQLSTAESFDDVMDLVEDKCTIVNIGCLEVIVNQYNITEANHHIENHKAAVDSFCQNIKANLCAELEIDLPYPGTIEFILEWEVNEHALHHIQCLLSKAFWNMAKKVLLTVEDKGKVITND